MSITRVLQPHVCCLGNPVAGNPTQFVMYRAARACGVDWRFFTSQVEVDQFEVAFRGVQALGLDGVALLEPFQSVVIPLLESVTESALCLGRVNVARSDGNSWLGDNTLGNALGHCIEAQHGKAGRVSAVLVLNSEPIARVLQLAMSEKSLSVISLGGESQSLDGMTAVPNEPHGELSARTSEAPNGTSTPSSGLPLEITGNTSNPVGTLILNELPTPNELRKLSSLSWSEAPKGILLVHRGEKEMRPFREWALAKNIKMIEPVELQAYQAAADFHFWTGVLPSVDLIRDSLEEYLQW